MQHRKQRQAIRRHSSRSMRPAGQSQSHGGWLAGTKGVSTATDIRDTVPGKQDKLEAGDERQADSLSKDAHTSRYEQSLAILRCPHNIITVRHSHLCQGV